MDSRWLMKTAAPVSIPDSRLMANYQPNSWDCDSLLSLDDNCVDEIIASNVEFEMLKKNVQHLLYNETDLVAQLNMVDVLQNVCLNYHFEEEIKNILESISIENAKTILADDLYATALLFRLLRENGFQVSQDIFDCFKDENGNFKECLCDDTKGVLSLYEAHHLGFEDEETLNEAGVFTTRHLINALKLHMDPHLKVKVERALELPLHWRTPRLDAKWHIEQYENDEEMKQPVLQLAKYDFNRVQSIHKAELKRLARWWKDLKLEEKLPFVRDRLVECYYYAAGVVPEPTLGHCREEITKVCNLITTIDGVYDVYGTFRELRLFTDAVKTWEFNAIDGLPEYMKVCYLALYDTTNEIAHGIRRQTGWDALPYLKKAWADLCCSFLKEASWQSCRYIPDSVEFLDDNWMSASSQVLLFHRFFLSTQCITEEAVHCLENYPDFVRSSSTIFQLCNDLATTTEELKRDVASSVPCYMHQQHVIEEDARECVREHIRYTMKYLNKDVADCSPFPRSFAKAAINVARISHCTRETKFRRTKQRKRDGGILLSY